VSALPDRLAFGEHRIGGGWIGIGIAGAAFTLIAGTQIAIGDWRALVAVGPILLIFALVCATTRTVALDFAAGRVAVTRRLLGLHWTRRWRLQRFTSVVVLGEMYLSKHARRDGTLRGDQKFMRYSVRLEGGSRVKLDLLRDPDAAEALAKGIAARLQVPAERHGYSRKMDSKGMWLARVVKRGRERLA
jgi:hypothetical protein